jgi:membrane associated rhomboid family serine protease
MIPLKDDLEPVRVPYVTWTLLALNILAFTWQLGLPQQAVSQFYLLWGMVPARIMHPEWAWFNGFPAGALLTLFTSMFIHGGWLHILGNGWALWLFGDDVEDRLGHARFAALYLGSGLIAGITHLLLFPDSTVPVVGASGAVAGLMGAFLLLFPAARIHVLVPIFFFIDIWKLPAAIYLPFWFLSELLSGAVALIAPGFSGIAFWAHIGGFMGGIMLLRLLTVQREPSFSPPRNPPEIIRGPGFIIINRSPWTNSSF